MTNGLHLQNKTRKKLRQKLANHSRLRANLRTIHRTYSNLTGFLHQKPNFYIIGVEKGGTSSLFGYLSEHPFINKPVTKEINFFNKYYFRGKNWYKVNFPFVFSRIFNQHVITGEASVRYFDYPHTIKRIKEFTPNAKFIALLRNPVERAFSEFSSTSRFGNEKLTFREAINIEKERTDPEFEKMLKDESYYHENYFRFGYLRRGIYADTLKNWFDNFPKERFLILKSEDFFENPSKYYNKTLDFLDLPNWEIDEYKIWRKVNTSKLDFEMRQELKEFFKPHNKKLYSLIGKNFDWENDF